jgi:peptidoglycan/LPS O-acetylase OafA/YrhL
MRVTRLVQAAFAVLVLMALYAAWTEPDAVIRLEACAVAALFAWSAYDVGRDDRPPP